MLFINGLDSLFSKTLSFVNGTLPSPYCKYNKRCTASSWKINLGDQVLSEPEYKSSHSKAYLPASCQGKRFYYSKKNLILETFYDKMDSKY